MQAEVAAGSIPPVGMVVGTLLVIGGSSLGSPSLKCCCLWTGVRHVARGLAKSVL